MDLARFIRDISDFPKPGVGFKDLTPLLGDAQAFAASIEQMVAPFRDKCIEKVCGIEARGFIFGAATAHVIGCGFVPLRKPGKLPAEKIAVDYALEYAKDRLEMHMDALVPGERVLLVDDVLATGGTLTAAASLVELGGGVIIAAAIVVEIRALAGRSRWRKGLPLHALVIFD